jgi:hypothetical protein
MRKNVDLAEKFLAQMRRDLAATRANLVSDRAELREDSGATTRPGGR